MTKLPYGTLMIVAGRTDERAAEKPIHTCMNCGCSILPSEGGARWVKWRPGFWLSDDEGTEHVDKDLCERQRREGEAHVAAEREARVAAAIATSPPGTSWNFDPFDHTPGRCLCPKCANRGA